MAGRKLSSTTPDMSCKRQTLDFIFVPKLGVSLVLDTLQLHDYEPGAQG